MWNNTSTATPIIDTQVSRPTTCPIGTSNLKILFRSFVSPRTTKLRDLCHHTGMKKTNLYDSAFYVRRTWTTFSGTVTKMDHVGPYHEGQEYAVAMQRKHDMDRAVPATEQITKWEWVDGVTAIADVVFG